MVDLLPARPVPPATSGQFWAGLRRTRATAPLGVGLFALVFTGALSWIPSPWYDEAATVSAATRTLPQLFALLQNVDAVHGAYYLLMHGWFSLVGYSPLTLRLPSTVATALAAALLVVLVRRLSTERRALDRLPIISGLVFVLLPRVTWMATEGRSYAITALFAVALTLVFHLAWGWGGRDRSQRILIWTAYGLLAALAGTTFIYLALLVAAHGVSAVILTVARAGRQPRRSLTGWFLASAGAGIALSSLAIDEAQQSHQVDWIHPLSAKTWLDVFQGQWFLGNNGFAAAAWLLIGAGAAVLVLRVVRQRQHQQRQRGLSIDNSGVLAAVILPWMLLPPVALLLESTVATPLFSPRYVTFAAPAVAVLIAVALTAVRRRWITAIALLVLLALTMPSWVHQRSPEGKQASAWGEVAAQLANERAAEPVGQSDAVIYGPLRRHPDADMAMLALAYPQQFSGLIDLKLGEPAADRGRLWEGRIALADARDRLDDAPVIWLVTSDKRDWRPSVAAQLATWGYQMDAEWNYPGSNLVRYVRG